MPEQSDINWFPFHHFFPLAITTFYTNVLKTQFKPLALSQTPSDLSYQVWNPHSGSSNSQPRIPFLFYSLSVHFLSSSFPSAALQFKLFPIACNTSFSFNANLNCTLSPVFNKELDFLHETDKPPKLLHTI